MKTLFTLTTIPVPAEPLMCITTQRLWCRMNQVQHRIFTPDDIPAHLAQHIDTLGIRIVSDYFRADVMRKNNDWSWFDWDAYPIADFVLPDGFWFAPMVDNALCLGELAEEVYRIMPPIESLIQRPPKQREGQIWYAVKRVLKRKNLRVQAVGKIVHLNYSKSAETN